MIPIAPGHDTLIHRCCKKTIALMATHDPTAISFACDECIGWLDFIGGCWHWSDGIAQSRNAEIRRVRTEREAKS